MLQFVCWAQARGAPNQHRALSAPRPSSARCRHRPCSGTRSAAAPTMRSRTAAVTSATAASGTSSTSSSCTCMMRRAGACARVAPGIHGDHGALDDVGRRALHGRVDGAALGVLLQLRVARADVGQIEPPPEHGLDVALRSRACARVSVHVALHAGIAREIELDVLLRGAARRCRAVAREPERDMP